ncbi:S1/P1 nuclease [Pseudoneurospora amorphoporcata]|uniref:S1/P1 nuclease n=1 Tax=Pseudoneurospora amorphoporcata TaxID=241081 RepID=A0AAN6NQT0_9PEZI|nr:S1/P1 nuclease [Pseudoneurospora amorphoporcata]
MKLSTVTIGTSAFLAGGASAWGGFGHITVAYLASNFVSNTTASYFQTLLRNDTTDYLANVATWADSIRYTKWGRWTGPLHYIDAKDSPPHSCGIVYERDCKPEGCVVSAIQNYTSRVLDQSLHVVERAQAAKFVVHFVGDIHQPLHTEDVEKGGNGISVFFDEKRFNLHHVWDSSIAEKIVTHKKHGVGRQPFPAAKKWAEQLAEEIREGQYKADSSEWVKGLELKEASEIALEWAVEGNAHVCTVVLPEGPEAIRGQELGGAYFEAAAPVVELQIAKAGYRLAAWLDLIVAAIGKNETISPPTLPIQKPEDTAGAIPIAEQKPMGMMLGSDL